MSFKVSPRETISRCESYDSKFRSYPEEVRIKAARIEKARLDSQETVAMKYERLLTAHFLKGEFVASSPKVAFAALIGKGLLIATFFPPYFVFVTFPRYTFGTIIPALYNKVEEPIVKVFKAVQKVVETGVDLFNQVIGKVARKLQINLPRPDLKFFKFSLPEINFEPLKAPFKVAAKLINAIKEVVKEKIDNFTAPIAKVYNAATKQVEKAVTYIEKHFKVFADFFKPAPPPFRAYGQKDPVPLWKQKVDEVKEKIKNIIEKASEIVAAPFVAAAEKLEPIVQGVIPFISAIPYYTMLGPRYIYEGTERRIIQIKNFLETLTVKTVEGTVRLYTAMIEAIDLRLQPLYRAANSINKGARFLGNKAKNSIVKRIKKMKDMGQSLKQSFNKFAKATVTNIKKIPAKALKIADQTFNVLVHLAKAFQTFCIIIGVVIKLAYLYIRNLNRRLEGNS